MIHIHDVDFVDINESTYNMDVTILEEKLKNAEIKPKIVIPVHFAGQSCEMEKIYYLSKKYGTKFEPINPAVPVSNIFLFCIIFFLPLFLNIHLNYLSSMEFLY